MIKLKWAPLDGCAAVLSGAPQLPQALQHARGPALNPPGGGAGSGHVSRMMEASEQTVEHKALAAPARPLAWLLGNLLLLAGLYLLLYVGGLYADTGYEQAAARGDNTLPPAAVESLPASAPNAFVVPRLNQPGSQAQQVASRPTQAGRSLVSRISIPRIGVDSKVIEVGWDVIEEQGQQVAIWQVAKYAVGHHKGSANPGEGSNIVLAGHVGGAAPVFQNLIQLEPGDQLTLYSQGRQYLYVVQDKLLLQEVGVPDEVRSANARYIDPTPTELVTLITCWPTSGPHKFDQRLLVRAVPYAANTTAERSELSNWSLR